MANPAPTRLENLLAVLALGIHDDVTRSLEAATGLAGSGPAALLALDEFLVGANVRRIADVLGITHSGAARLVAQLDADGLVARVPGDDRRNVEVRLTGEGRRRARRARAARTAVARGMLADLHDADAEQLERILHALIAAGVRARMRTRAAGNAAAWWCRTCDFAACGRPEGRCPAATTAALGVDG
jgi:DNA-binding MarR family transcriptional regulator